MSDPERLVPPDFPLHSLPLEALAARTPDTLSVDTTTDAPPDGDRWSTWDVASHGPTPRPDWVITDLGAVDVDLGTLKTGKEADVVLVRRFLPGTTRSTVHAAKRFRSPDHRLFHRDAGYLEGRRVRRSRETRAMTRRTDFGRSLIAGQWAVAEFATLADLWSEGLPVPYPVQLDGVEILMELVGGDTPAPRLAAARPPKHAIPGLFDQVVDVLTALARRGLAHGDLSAYNILLDGDRLVVIDWPQVVDIIGNPQGMHFLHRDVVNVCAWFHRQGFDADPEELFGVLVAEATSRW